MQITREQFQEAIRVGIHNARGRMTVEQAQALAEVGRTATKVGVGSFNDCPWTLALGPRRGDQIRLTALLFAGGFDKAIDHQPGQTTAAWEVAIV